MSENESEVEETREENPADTAAHDDPEVEEAVAGEAADDEDLADDEEDFDDDEDDDEASEGKAGSVSSEQSNDDTLYTLTEVSERTNISMPTLQRYKKNYQDRIPSVGEGRTQRYPPESLPVFEKLKEENMKRRGRPRKNASEKRSKAAAAQRRRPVGKPTKAEDTDELLTLKQIEEMTGISYPTLLRYVKTNLNRIPHTGSGRRRRYPPEAVEIFKTLREESRRGRRARPTGPVQVGSSPSPPRQAPEGGGAPMSQSAVADLVQRMKELQRSHQQLQRQVQKLEKEIQKPLKVTVKRGA